jgi:hypothetical protein
MVRILPVVIAVGLAIYALLDVVTTPASEVRNLPKWAWIPLIVIGTYIGPIAWLVAGRPKGRGRGARPKRRQLPPDDDPDFLRKL